LDRNRLQSGVTGRAGDEAAQPASRSAVHVFGRWEIRIQHPFRPGTEDLFRIDIATGAETVVGNVGREFQPGSNLSPSIRFSLAPDGKSFVYGSGTFTNNLWMLEGFAVKHGLFASVTLRTSPSGSVNHATRTAVPGGLGSEALWHSSDRG